MRYRGDPSDVIALVKYAQSLEIKIDEIRRQMERVNEMAVCVCMATPEECYDLLQECAKISDLALSEREAA